MAMKNECRQDAFAVAGSTGACHKNNFDATNFDKDGNVTNRSFQWIYSGRSFPH